MAFCCNFSHPRRPPQNDWDKKHTIVIQLGFSLPNWIVAFKMEKRWLIIGRWANDGLLGRAATGPGRGWWQRWCTLNANAGLGNAQTGAHWNAELMCFLRVIYWGGDDWNGTHHRVRGQFDISQQDSGNGPTIRSCYIQAQWVTRW